MRPKNCRSETIPAFPARRVRKLNPRVLQPAQVNAGRAVVAAQSVAALIKQINAHEAPAIFVDAGDNPALAQQIAAETSVKVVTNLHLESLTDGPPAATYIDMMKHNVTKMVEALR